MSWNRVRTWRDRLRAVDAATLDTGLSPEGARGAWSIALDALDDDALDAAAAIPGDPYPTAALVIARTVFTAPIEWAAVLLGRGTALTVKHPRGFPGAVPILARLAEDVGLPLAVTDERAAVARAELVVAMGSDETVDALRGALAPGTRALLFGHRFSAAWVDDPLQWAALAQAAWPHDGRGCLSPQVALTPIPLPQAVDGLATAMEAAERQVPRGEVGAGEGARVRARGALARVTGAERHGDGWAVHGLTARHWHPEGLPRTPAVVQVADRAEARAILAPWSRWMSTVGDDGAGSWDGARVCPIGAMQRPPLDRLHDGVDWLRETVRPARDQRMLD